MSGLWVPSTINGPFKFQATERTVTLPSGERAKITVDDSGTVKHRETAERLDCKVTPQGVTVKVPPSLQPAVLEMIRLQRRHVRR